MIELVIKTIRRRLLKFQGIGNTLFNKGDERASLSANFLLVESQNGYLSAK
jgi:hypothetical protein